MAVDQLEPALQAVERDIDAAMKAVTAVLKEVKKAKTAASLGQLRDLRQALAEAESLSDAAADSLATVRAGWVFDEQAHFASGAYAQEVLARARAEGVQAYYSDERLLCYPAIVAFGDLSVLVDKARDRRVRPSVFVRTLKALQSRPPRFKAEVFLESLAAAYDLVVAKTAVRPGTVVRLTDLYAVFTVMPGAAKEYTKQELARDVNPRPTPGHAPRPPVVSALHSGDPDAHAPDHPRPPNLPRPPSPLEARRRARRARGRGGQWAHADRVRSRHRRGRPSHLAMAGALPDRAPPWSPIPSGTLGADSARRVGRPRAVPCPARRPGGRVGRASR